MEDIVKDRLRRSRLCSGLPDERLAEMARIVRYEHRAPGDVLFRAGEPADRFFVLLDGHVLLTIDDGSPHGTIARIVHGGETFAETAVCGLSVYEETAETVAPSTLAVFPGSVLADLLVEHVDLVMHLLGTLSMQLRGLIRQISDLKMKSAAQRLASHLLGFTDVVAGPAEIRLPYARWILARDLGMQPETLSRAFVKLQPLGVTSLRHRDVCRIADVAILRAFCRDDGEEAGS